MTVKVVRGRRDKVIEQIVTALQNYDADHPDSRIELYRQNSVSIRIRIIDPALARKDRVQRHDLVWKYLDELPDETKSDISVLLLLSPDETKHSLGNLEFEHPTRTNL